MCHSLITNRKIKKPHERCSRFIYSDKQPWFSELLEMKGSVFIHMRNKYLIIEMFCESGNLPPSIMNDIFTQKGNSWYNLRQISKFSRPLVKSVRHGSKSVSYLGSIKWDMLSDDCKDIDDLGILRIQIRNGKLKIVLADSIKLTLTIKVLFEKEKKGVRIQVVFLELWLLLASNVLLPISTCFFFTFLTNYL